MNYRLTFKAALTKQHTKQKLTRFLILFESLYILMRKIILIRHLKKKNVDTILFPLFYEFYGDIIRTNHNGEDQKITAFGFTKKEMKY